MLERLANQSPIGSLHDIDLDTNAMILILLIGFTNAIVALRLMPCQVQSLAQAFVRHYSP